MRTIELMQYKINMIMCDAYYYYCYYIYKSYKYIKKKISELDMHSHKKLHLGYWKARGKGEVARQMMALCGQDWDEKHYTGNGEEWFGKDKKQLGIPLPNLPYLIDGDFKLTESGAIYRHILRKFGKREYLGRSVNDEAVVDQLLGVADDIDHALLLFWDPDWKNKLEDGKKKGVPKLQKLNELYGENTYALGYPTLPDFVYAELSYYLEKIIPEQYEKLPFLARLRKQVSNITEIKQYYEKKGSLPFVEQGDLKF